MRAGFGAPPEGKMCVNISRFLDWAQCGRHYEIRYEDNQVGTAYQKALDLGTMWHKLKEIWAKAGKWESNPEVALAVAKQFEHEDESLLEWVQAAWPAYIRRYPDAAPAGTALAVEQQVWLDMGDFYIVGVVDSITIKRENKEFVVYEGQTKTLAATKDPVQFATDYERSWHGIAYGLALHHAPPDEWAKLKVEFPVRYGGTGLDIVHKLPIPTLPVNTTKNGRITEHFQKKMDKYYRAQDMWEPSLFHYQEVPFDPESLEVRDAIHQWMEIFDAMALGIYIKNPAACDDWYHGKCLYKGRACLHGKYDALHYEKREPDYVDRSNA